MVKDSIQLLELPVLDLSVLWISDYRSCSGLRGSYLLSQGSYSACSVGMLGRPLLSALCAEVMKSFHGCLAHIKRPVVLVMLAETQQQEGQSCNSTELAFGENVPL